MCRSSRLSSGVYFMQKFKTQGQYVNFCDILQTIWNINYNLIVILDGVSFCIKWTTDDDDDDDWLDRNM